jgi:mRNA interferase MazF
MPSRGEAWWAFGGDRTPVVILSSSGESELRAIQVVSAAETDISGVAIELPVGCDEGLPSGVLRIALAREGRINCAWLLSLDESDLSERAGDLSEAKLSRLEEMLRLGGLE